MTVNVAQGCDRWRPCAAEDLIVLPCGEDFVAYHRPSGKTHLLNPSSYRLLMEVLADHPGLAEIAARCQTDDEVPGEEFVEHLSMMLHDLERFGLVERV